MSNRLINSSSPYLLQHAGNPVDWYPWGMEALEKARLENKPIILSIGYSACHWCHVMEHQCFENESIAAQMNAGFINIKVDREERPDVDNLYMDALHLMGMQGGWPLNVFLTPDQLPFYGGTYFPPQQWSSILEQIAKAHREKPDELRDIGRRNKEGLGVSFLERFSSGEKHRETEEILRSGLEKLRRNFDPMHGGFGQAPKFPMPCIYRYLLHRAAVRKEPECREMAIDSLEKMAIGGIHDVLAGGFARYSVDAEWRIPHFEKMLYDNAQLCSLFSIAWLESKKDIFRDAAGGIIRFVNSELQHPDGGFFSALDADSEGEEGRFYVWTNQELAEELGADYEAFARYYFLPEEGNFEHGKSVLMSRMTEEEYLSKYEKQEAEEVKSVLTRCRLKLLKKRSSRIRPGLDDKIICSWNAMMITGLCDAYRTFGNTEYLQLAGNCASFIKSEMLMADGRLFRIWKNGIAHTDAFLDDYSHLLLAFADLAEASFKEEWLIQAEQICDYVNEHFYDPSDGLFHYTARNGQELIARQKELSDNVIPSSNARMAMALHRLSRLLHREDYMEKAVSMCKAIEPMLQGDLRFASEWMQVLLLIHYPPPDIALTGAETEEFRVTCEQLFLPGRTIFGSKKSSEMAVLKDKSVKPGKTQAWVCSGQHCLAPVSSVSELAEILGTFRMD
jgi:uncharacterized protein YyaL (SSP411 family)